MSKPQQIVRISSLAKFLDTVENTATTLLGTKYMYRTAEETEAFKEGMKASLKIIRQEYGIIEEDS